MKLLPFKFKWIGLIILIPSLVLGIFVTYYDFRFSFLYVHPKITTVNDINFSDYNYTNEFALTGIIVGLLMIGFSREKHEDEYINKLRLESLQWAVMINYVLLLAVSWFINGVTYFQVMIYNMLTVLIIFILCFHWMLIRTNRNTNK